MYVAECMWAYFLISLLKQLWCIGHCMTMLEMEKPYAFVSSRLDSVFEIKRQRLLNATNKVKKKFFTAHYAFQHVGMCQMFCNILGFLFYCRKGVHKPRSSEQRLSQIDETKTQSKFYEN